MPSRILSYLKIVKGLTPFKKILPNFSIIGNYIVSSHKFELLYTNRYVMKKYRPLLLIFLLFVALAGYAQEGKQYFTHIVKKGETLYSLSQMYGTTVEAIKNANPGKTKVLKINQQLRIPQTTTLVPEGKDGKGIWKGDLFHTIKAKETLYSLSKEYGIDYIEICNANPGLSPTNFRIGEVIVIPLSKVSENAKKEESLPVTESEIAVVSRYKASKGETIDEICAAHGVLKEDFVRVNPHLKSTEIRKKTIVNIPEKRSKADMLPKTQPFALTTGKHKGHDWVDLGLPSGLKWATCNVGASSPSDYGDYFAWGEISTKSSYDDNNSTTFLKEIGDIAGNPTYDVARAKWRGSWRLPTEKEFQELIENCTWEWTTQDGVNGFRVTSK